MASTEIQNLALHRAAELLGGPDELAQYLGVPQSYLRVWLAGKPIPATVFLRTIDIIVEHEMDSLQAEAANRRKQA
jgi:hypothetical protein